jgi:hypothetical protein
MAIFKALTSIMAWVLFITGLIGVVISFGEAITLTVGTGGAFDPNTALTIDFLVAAITLAAAAYVMKVRKMLE